MLCKTHPTFPEEFEPEVMLKYRKLKGMYRKVDITDEFEQLIEKMLK